MSKKVSNVDPISLLREYITGNKPIKHSEDTLIFGSTKLPLSTPTGSKYQTKHENNSLESQDHRKTIYLRRSLALPGLSIESCQLS